MDRNTTIAPSIFYLGFSVAKKPSLIKMILLGIILFVSISCNSDDGPPPEPANSGSIEPIPQPSGTSLKYLALGDSYTIGQGVEEEDRWPNQLARNLELGLNVNVEVEFIARSGWTTTSLLSAIEERNPAEQDLVSLLIGVNNQYQKVAFSRFEEEFDELIGIGLQLAGQDGHFFVVSIPDYGVTPFGSSASQSIGQEIDRYNYHIRQRCAEEDIPFIDVTETSRELGDSPGALAGDRLHPSAAQYRTWVEKIYPVVSGLLN